MHSSSPSGRAAPTSGAPADPPAGILAEALVEVRGLHVDFPSGDGPFAAVHDVSLEIRRGETFGIVGESGSGKTMTALSLMRLLPDGARLRAERLRLDGRDLLACGARELRRMRGRDVAMVFQEPMTSLSPSVRIGRQLTETLRVHLGVGGTEARERAVAMLTRVGIPSPRLRMDDYPHQLSGGMRQRVTLAIALLLEPKLLLADEPTTALDATIQAQILELLAQLRDQLAMTLVLVSHDLGVVRELADRVAVMYAGEIVEQGSVADVLDRPRHPYTAALVRSMPERAAPGARLPELPGEPPGRAPLPRACRFAPRCERRLERCEQLHPALATDAERALRCLNPCEAMPA